MPLNLASFFYLELNAVILHWRPKATLPCIGLQNSISNNTRTAVSLSSMHGVFIESSLRKQQVTQAHYLCHVRVSYKMSKYREHMGAKFRSGNLLENGNKNRWNFPCGEFLLSFICTRSFVKNSLLYLSYIVVATILCNIKCVSIVIHYTLNVRSRGKQLVLFSRESCIPSGVHHYLLLYS